MRARGWVLGFLGLLLAGAAIAGALLQKLSLPAWLTAATGAIAVLVVAILTDPIKEVIKGSVISGSSRAKLLRLHALGVNRRGRLPKVGSYFEPVKLGVHPSLEVPCGSDDSSQLDDVPVYVPRGYDEELEEALQCGGLVILEGRSAAGKTRSAYEAASRLFPDRKLLIPANAKSLEVLADAHVELKGTVIWLDNIEYYLLHGLNARILEALCPAKRGP
nr:hypothetical protein GCM10020093_051920 [Planobispora longispora]